MELTPQLVKAVKGLEMMVDSIGSPITEFDSFDEIFAAYFKTVPFETLHDMSTAIPSQSVQDMAKAEMQRRMDKAFPVNEKVDVYLEEELIALELKEKEADQ